jgi:hypothetical protein
MSFEKYIIILDTNVLGSYKNNSLIATNFKYLSICKNIFISLIDFLKGSSLKQNISIAIPKIVIEELNFQQESTFNSQIEQLKENFVKFKELSNFKLEIPDHYDYKTHLADKTEAFIGKYSIEVINYPPNDVLPRLIKKVLNKEKPFYKKEKQKDSGFKDALIWESIIDYAKKRPEKNFIFFTKDTDFNNSILLEEFKKITEKELKIMGSLTEVKTFLDETQQLHLDFRLISILFDESFKENLYKVLRNHFFEIKTYNGTFLVIDYKIGKSILDVNKINKDIYEIFVPIDVLHETPYTGYSIVDNFYQPYERDQHSGIAILKLRKTATKEIFLQNITFDMIDLLGQCISSEIRLK